MFFQRHKVLKALGITAATLSLSPSARADLLSFFSRDKAVEPPLGKPLDFTQPAAWHLKTPLTPVDKVTGYNNFYEFGLDKADPTAHAGGLKTEGWQIRIEGEGEGEGETDDAGHGRYFQAVRAGRTYLPPARNRPLKDIFADTASNLLRKSAISL